MEQGYLKIYRKFFDSEFWLERRTYSKADAWIDLLQLARYATTQSVEKVHNASVVVDRGQYATSKAILSARWCWSKWSVGRFLKTLREKEMITTQAERGADGWLLITIVNYDRYNSFADTDPENGRAPLSAPLSAPLRAPLTELNDNELQGSPHHSPHHYAHHLPHHITEESKKKDINIIVNDNRACACEGESQDVQTAPVLPTAPAVTDQHPPKPPSHTTATEAQRLAADIARLSTDTIWQQAVMMQNKIHDPALWQTLLTEFQANCIAQGTRPHSDLRDLKAHFTNWLRIRLAAQKREQDANNRRIPTKAEANAAALDALAQRRFELDHGNDLEPVDRPF